MSVSKYNADESFNASLFLYLQPEIQVRENLKTVEDAFAFYENKKDNPDDGDDPSTWLWSLSFIPDSFDPRTFIVIQKTELNTSLLSQFIASSMELDGFTKTDIDDEREYVKSIGVLARIKENDILVVSDENFAFTPRILQKGDKLRIVRQIVFTTIFVDVTEIIDNRSIRIKNNNETFDIIDEEYEIIGIQIVDIQRVARINYLRYLVENGEPPSEFAVNTLEFNPELYRLIYPSARALDDDEAFLDYKERLSKDPETFGKIDDFIRVFLGTSDSNEENQDKSLFETLSVTNRLVLDFPQNKQSGFLRFIDQDVYYITRDSERSSDELSAAFQGLITEKAIKKYIEEMFANPPPITAFEVVGDAIFHSGIQVTDKSLFDSNSITNFEGVVNFESNIVFNGHAIFHGDMSILSEKNTEFRNIVEFYDWVKFFGENVFLKRTDFLGNVNLSGYTDFCVNEEIGPIEGQTVHFHLPTAFFDDTWIQKNLVIREDATLETDENAESYFYGPVTFSNHTAFQKLLTIDSNCELLFLSSNIDFASSFKVTGDAFFTNSSKTYFDGDVFMNNNMTFKGKALFLDDIEVVSKNNTKFRNNVDFYDWTILHGQLVSWNRCDFTNNVNFSGYTDFNVNPKIGPIDNQYVHFHLDTSFFEAAMFYNNVILDNKARLETREDVESTFFGKVGICNDIYFQKLDIDNPTNFYTSNVFFRKGANIFGQTHFDSNSSTIFDGNVSYSSNVSFEGKTVFLNDVEVVSKENSKFRNNVDFYGWTILHGQLVAANRCDFINNVNFSGYTDFNINEKIGPVQGQTVHFHLPTTFFDDTWISNNIVIRREAVLLTENESISVFEGNSTFSNNVDYYDTITFHDININGVATFHNDISFKNNVNIGNCIQTNEIEVLENALFKSPASFEKNVEFYSNVNYNDKTIYNGDAEFNNLAHFNSKTSFNGETIFNDELVFNANNTFNGLSIFKSNVEFDDNVFVYGLTHYYNHVNFEDNVNFKNESYFDLLASFNKIDAFTFSASNAFLNNFVSKQKSIFENSVEFNENSHIFGNITFCNAQVTFDRNCPVEFHDHVKMNKTELNNQTTIHDTLLVEAIQTIFEGSGDVLFQNKNTTFNTSSIFNSNVYHNSFVEFNNLVIFEDKVKTKNLLSLQGTTETQGKFYANAYFETTPLSRVRFDGDIQFISASNDVVFQSHVVMNKKSDIKDASICNLEAENAIFNNNVDFNGKTFLNGSETYVSHLNTENVEHIKDVNFKSSSHTKFLPGSKLELLADDIVIDSPNLRVFDIVHFQNINASNINIDIGYFDEITSKDLIIEKSLISTPNTNVEILGRIDIIGESFARNIDIGNSFIEKAKILDLNVDKLRVNETLDIDNIFTPILNSTHNSNENCFIEKGKSVKHDIDTLNANQIYVADLNVENGYIDHLKTQDLYSSNLHISNSLDVYETNSEYLYSRLSTLEKARITYARIITSSNDNAFFHDQTSYSLNCSNLYVRNSEFEHIHASNISAKNTYIDNLSSLHSEIDTFVSTHKAFLNDAYTVNNYVNNSTISNAEIETCYFRNMNGSNLNVENAHLSNAFVNEFETNYHLNNEQYSKDLYSSNIYNKNAEIERGHLENAQIDHLENEEQASKISHIETLNTSNIEIKNKLTTLGEVKHLGPSHFFHNTQFHENIDVNGGAHFTGDLHIEGKNNKISEVEIDNAQFTNSIRFQNTPLFKNNVVINGICYASRIGIGPNNSNKIVNNSQDVDMKNVFMLNKQSGTKIFGKKAYTFGIDGGICVLEVLKYPNAIIHLADGTDTIQIMIHPQSITPQMLGITGKITLLERSIYGRSISWNENVKPENKQDNITYTDTSPNTNGGYCLHTFEYTILGLNLISVRNISTNKMENNTNFDENENCWIFDISSMTLFVTHIQQVGMLHYAENKAKNEDIQFISYFQHYTSPFYQIDVENFGGIIKESVYDKSILLFLNQKGDIHDVIKFTDEDFEQNGFKYNLLMRSHFDHKAFNWATTYRENPDNNEIIPLSLYNKYETKIDVPIPYKQENKKDKVSLIAYHHDNHDNNTRNSIVPSWYKVIKNGTFTDIAINKSKENVCLIKPSETSHYVKIEEYESPNGQPEMTKISKSINIPKENEFNPYHYIIKLNEKGEFIWSIAINENHIDGLVVKNNNEILFFGTFKPSQNLTFRQSNNEIEEYHFAELDSNTNDASPCCFITSLFANGMFNWTISIISESLQYNTYTSLLKNDDVLFSFHMDNPDYIRFYNKHQTKSKEVNPKETSSIPFASWNDYHILAKYNPKGELHWNLFITSIENQIKIAPTLDGGFITVFSPHYSTQSNEKECVIFNFDGSKAFDATSIMDEQRTHMKKINHNKILQFTTLVISKFDTFGKVMWVSYIKSIIVDENFSTRFEEFDVASLSDGSIIIGLGNKKEESGKTDQRPLKMIDSSLKEKELKNVVQMKLTSTGRFRE